MAHSITLVTLFKASGSSGRSATGLAISLEKKVLFNHIPPSPPSATFNSKEKNAPSWEAAGHRPTNPTVLESLLSGTNPLTRHNMSHKE